MSTWIAATITHSLTLTLLCILKILSYFVPVVFHSSTELLSTHQELIVRVLAGHMRILYSRDNSRVGLVLWPQNLEKKAHIFRYKGILTLCWKGKHTFLSLCSQPWQIDYSSNNMRESGCPYPCLSSVYVRSLHKLWSTSLNLYMKGLPAKTT